MDDRDHRSHDSDSPTMPGLGDRRPAAAALTPPPLSNAPSSDAPTMQHNTPIPPPSGASSAASSISAFISLQTGSIFAGRYEIMRVLGQGGMGAVYQARDRELDRIIALKVIRPELATDPAILARFKQELILARNITHKNVVRIYDLGESNGIRFITMEYVDGQDLRTLLRQHGKFSPQQAIGMMEQVCRALDCAHTEGVIHRDLKPQNIMRDSQSRIVVMDFGLARSLGDSGLTQTGAIVGTMEYMSPEQALGATLDQRSDIFSVGLIFYELLTGKAPYHAETAIASLMKRTREQAIPASDVDNSVPQSLSAIVSRCLEREPADRYHSVVELLQQLNTWVSNPNISADQLSKMISHPIMRLSRFELNLPGKRWMWITGAVLTLVLAVFVGRMIWGGKQAAGTQEIVKGIPALNQGKYVAILPLKIVGDEKALGYVGDGIQEALAAKLFQLKEVHLASSSAVDKVAHKDLPLSKVAHELGVNLVVQGMVQGSPDKLSVILNLYDAASGRPPLEPGILGHSARSPHAGRPNLRQRGECAGTQAQQRRNRAARARGPTENTFGLRSCTCRTKCPAGTVKTPMQLRCRRRITRSSRRSRRTPSFAFAYAGLADSSLRLYGESKDSIWAQKAVTCGAACRSTLQHPAGSPSLPRERLLDDREICAGDHGAEARSRPCSELRRGLSAPWRRLFGKRTKPTRRSPRFRKQCRSIPTSG